LPTPYDASTKMSEPVIQARNVSKKFILNHQGAERYSSLRDSLTRGVIAVFKRENARFLEEFWALRDIDFDIHQGDRVGIIGRNGAGKSTLLKILCRISEPTAGSVAINGRVASLLEVGTGFHPELTGRENIFLNGSILGMSRMEIRQKFDEIVDFAEIEKFLDTPVKRYSSGMYVRLAFAVAAHLEPEILVVDEVLAVGDAQFQKKCLGKMEGVSKHGRTVLFVSHNTAALLALCNKGIVLDQGLKIFQGEIGDAVNNYNNSVFRNNNQGPRNLSENLQLGELKVAKAKIHALDDMGISLRLNARNQDEVIKSIVLVVQKDGKRVGVLDLRSAIKVARVPALSTLHCDVTIKSCPLVEGDYTIGMYVESTTLGKDFTDLANFSILPKQISSEDATPYDVSVRGAVEFRFNADVAFS
jgi:lipopolysaccharide transport system ATP-binding protein